MDRYDRLAAWMIDDIEDAIQANNPELLELVRAKGGNTFLHGVCYHELESSLACSLRQLVAYKVGRALAKDAARRSRSNRKDDRRELIATITERNGRIAGLKERIGELEDQVAESKKQFEYENDARKEAECTLDIENKVKDWDRER